MTDGHGEVGRVSWIGGMNDELRTERRAILSGEPIANVSKQRFETAGRAPRTPARQASTTRPGPETRNIGAAITGI